MREAICGGAQGEEKESETNGRQDKMYNFHALSLTKDKGQANRKVEALDNPDKSLDECSVIHKCCASFARETGILKVVSHFSHNVSAVTGTFRTGGY